MSLPSSSTVPASGRIRPMAILMVTDLPWPDPPMITRERPALADRLMPSSTGAPPKLLRTSRHSSFVAASLIGG